MKYILIDKALKIYFSGTPEHGAHPYYETANPHSHHNHGADHSSGPHEHDLDHESQPYHPHLPGQPLGLHEYLYNFHGSQDPQMQAAPSYYHTGKNHNAPEYHPDHVDGNGNYEFHSHPLEERKVLIAKIEFAVETSMLFYDFLADASSYSYKHMAAKIAEMFDSEFERVAKDFKMDMTGLYVKFDDSLNHHHDDLIWDEHDHVFKVSFVIILCSKFLLKFY